MFRMRCARVDSSEEVRYLALDTVVAIADEAGQLERRVQTLLASFKEKYRFPGATAAFVLPDITLVGWSLFGAIVVNLIIGVNHRHDRYIAT